MSYQVLARKWRPLSFSQLTGQEHVATALKHALDNDRLHHAYLFTGTRGVGKTTIARILAKCLNCETGMKSNPCEVCNACQAINEGRFIDLIEIDAASRTKVEDTREILENVQYAPSHGRFKVYLIDEVHMLSTHSFNALLKTLEEPPPHVKFILATTDPKKLPITVLSRCLQFNLKHLSASLISDRLAYILTEEKISFDNGALKQLSRSADGSMRDALSLTDQAIAYGNGQVNSEIITSMLGSVNNYELIPLLQALVDQDAQVLLKSIEKIAQFTSAFDELLERFIELIHKVVIYQTLGNNTSSDQIEEKQLIKIAGQVTAEDLQLWYQISLLGRRDLSLSPDPRIGFELVFIRMLAFLPDSPNKPPITPMQALPNSESTVENKAIKLQPDNLTKNSEAINQERVPAPTTSKSSLPIDNTHERQQLTPRVDENIQVGSVDKAHSVNISDEVPASQHVNSALGPEDARVSMSQNSGAENEAILIQPEKDIVDGSLPESIKPIDNIEILQDVKQLDPAHLSEITNGSGRVSPEHESHEFCQVDWGLLFPQLELSGMDREIASHYYLDKQQANKLFFSINEDNAILLTGDNDQRNERIAQSVEKVLGYLPSIELNIQPVAGKTPAMLFDEAQQEKLRAVKYSIENDGKLHAIVQEFDADLIPASVKPID